MKLFRKKQAPPVENSVEIVETHEERDYYDWKARYNGWYGVKMMTPVLVAAGVLALCVLILAAFIFHPLW